MDAESNQTTEDSHQPPKQSSRSARPCKAFVHRPSRIVCPIYIYIYPLSSGFPISPHRSRSFSSFSFHSGRGVPKGVVVPGARCGGRRLVWKDKPTPSVGLTCQERSHFPDFPLRSKALDTKYKKLIYIYYYYYCYCYCYNCYYITFITIIIIYIYTTMIQENWHQSMSLQLICVALWDVKHQYISDIRRVGCQQHCRPPQQTLSLGCIKAF